MIYTLTLNPAVDKILYLNHITPCTTNRIQRQTITIGGKGTHVSINLSLLGIKSKALGFTHGKAGSYIRQEMERYGVEPLFCHYEGKESRTNYLCIEEETGSCTILAEKGPPPSPENMAELKEQMDQILREGDWLVLSGDASNCPDPCVYSRFIRDYSSRGIHVVLDSSGETLKNALFGRPALIKPNQDELAQIMGRPIVDAADAAVCVQDLYEKYGIPYIAVSLGGDGSICRTPEGMFRAYSPKVSVRNTAGCGDCFLAGLLSGLSTGLDCAQTLRMATAISSAAAESALSIGYDAKRAEELKQQVVIEKWNGIFRSRVSAV